MDGWMRSEKVSTARIGDEHDDACDLREATHTMFLALFSLSQVSRNPCCVEVLDHSKEWEVMILWNGKLLNHYWKQ